MTGCRNFGLLLLILTLLGACQQKKKPSLSGEEPVAVSDFIDFFPASRPPSQFTDTTVIQKSKDSLLISYKVFTQFVPDSTAGKLFGKGVKPRIYPIFRVTGPASENYLFVKSAAGEKKSAHVLVFGKKDKLMDAMTVMTADNNAATAQSVTIDRACTISKLISRKNPDGSLSEGSDVFSYNDQTGKLMLIQTNALDEKAAELINPIDTFARKHKFSADYGSGKNNLVSIRDGRKSDRISFFIHFEANNGSCSGELKGEAIFKSPATAEYREGGDPCVLRFNFTAGSVTLTEQEGCGSHRGLRCSFNGSYPRKKEPKSKSPKKKTGRT